MDIIDKIIQEEGPPTNDPLDKGGPTAYGISQASNPQAWKNGPPTEAQARAIYEAKYVQGPGFDKVTDQQLRNQLVDFGVNSGPVVAIQKLQGVLQVPVDGVLGPETILALSKAHPEDIANHLVATRVKMICQFVEKNPSQIKFLTGWVNRALQFLS